ncbi:MAG: hypothetical protein HYZ48_02445 [Chlamydiales bacterium]|nr:hypothetical protein [Chlamydiales bacterium]
MHIKNIICRTSPIPSKTPWKAPWRGYCLLGGLLMASSLYGGSPVREATLNDHLQILGDFVYMRRQHSTAKTLVNNPEKERFCGSCSDYSVLRTNALINDMGFEPGFRASLIYRNNPKMSFEGSFLWVSQWKASKEIKGKNLYFGFKDPDYRGDYIDADEAKTKYDSQFWTAEVNAWRHWTPRYVDYFSLSGILGFRYFHFNEGLDITYLKAVGAAADKSDYQIHTKSDAFGVQGGLDFQVNPTQTFTWEISAKFGFMMDHVEEKQYLRDIDNTVVLRHFKRQKWQNGCFADVAAWIGFQFKDHLQLHGGYEMFFLSSVATAEDQISKRLSSGAGKVVDPDGAVIIHGLFAGMIISF